MKDSMSSKHTITFITALITTIIAASDVTTYEPLLDNNFLKNQSTTQELLLKHGFKKIFFTTPDNINLCSLFLDHSPSKKIVGTIIYCAGFYPGTKEGMSSFYALMKDQPYNFLIFDARGHCESQGSLFSYQSLKNYGCHEYLDIIGVIDFINNYNKQNKLPEAIIIHGICSGAFNAIKAIDYITQQKEKQTVQAIIFDSGWLQVADIVESTIQAEISKRLNNAWCSWLINPASYIVIKLYRLILKPHHQKISGIQEMLANINCPVFFVHCTNDPYVPIQPIKNFTEQKCCAHTWWIPHDAHANFHTQAPKEYKNKMLKFLKELA